jgi:cold shock protein
MSAATGERGGHVNGTIIRLVGDKGFGFIRGTDGVERFFHRSELRGASWPPDEKDPVTFDHEDAEKGPRAVNVRLAD